jgi:hypothetical protein
MRARHKMRGGVLISLEDYRGKRLLRLGATPAAGRRSGQQLIAGVLLCLLALGLGRMALWALRAVP